MRTKRIVSVLVGAGLSLVLLTGCAEQLGDRGGHEGSPVDVVSDVDYIEVYRNADLYPNIAKVCVDGLGFATPSSGRSDSGGGATPLLRMTEWDQFCSGKRPAGK